MWGGQYRVQKTQGFATLLFTMIVLASITAFAFISANTVVSNQANVKTYHQKQSAFNIAQAGLDYAIPYLDANYSTITDGSSQQINIPGGGYAVLSFAFVGDKNTIRVTSTGYANGNNNGASVQQLVKYQTSGPSTKTFAQPIVAKSVALAVKTTVNGNPTNLISARVNPSGMTLDGSSYTRLFGVNVSKNNALGSDIADATSIFSGKTTNQLEIDNLGKKISEFATVSTDQIIPLNSGASSTHTGSNGGTTPVIYFNQTALDPYKTKNALLFQGPNASKDIDIGFNFPHFITLGSPTSPVTVVVDYTAVAAARTAAGSTPMTKLLGRSKIYGDLIVKNGNLQIDTAAQVFGNVIVENGTALIKMSSYCNPTATSASTVGCNTADPNVTGALIASGDVTLRGGVVNGVVYTNGTLNVILDTTTSRQGRVSGAVFANKVTTNAANIDYMADLAKITSSGGSSSGTGTSGYARVAGSWTDI